MIKMSFYDGTLKRDELKNFINQTEKALEIVSNEVLLDVDEDENFIHLNAYSSNDMY